MRFLLIVLFTFIGIVSFAQPRNVRVVSTSSNLGTALDSSYLTLSDAFASINNGTNRGVITITVSGNTTEPASNISLRKSGFAGTATPSSYSSVRIRVIGNDTIFRAVSTAGRGTISFAGADNVTLDGDDPDMPGSRNLTIMQPTSSANNTAVIIVGSNTTSDKSDSITIMNCNIIGSRYNALSMVLSYGIAVCDGGTYSTTNGVIGFYGSYGAKNLRILNNAISRCSDGISVSGNTGSPGYYIYGLEIRDNLIGSEISAENIGRRGIYVSNTATASTYSSSPTIIRNNDIRAGDYVSSGFGNTLAGIEVNVGCYGIIIDGNKIHDIVQPWTSAAAYGIYFNANNSLPTVSNNMIWNIRCGVTSSSPTAIHPDGVWFNATINDIYFCHNTIVMGAQPSTTISTYVTCVNTASSNGTGVYFSKFSNNILVNRYTSFSTYTYCIYTSQLTYFNSITTTATADHNDYYLAVPGGKFGGNATTNYTSLAAWSAATGRDLNSINLDPPFAGTADFHLDPNGGNYSSFNSTGVPVSVTGVQYDADGLLRCSPPDIGADEYTSASDFTPVSRAVLCQGSATAPIYYTSTAGSPDFYSINFDYAANAAGFSDINYQPAGPSPIAVPVPPAAPIGDYYGTLYEVKQVSGAGCESGEFEISISISNSGSWTGLVDSDWNNAGNWCGAIPDASTDVSIGAGCPHYPVIDGNTIPTATCNNLNVTGGTIEVNDAGNLIVNGSMTMD